MTRVMASGGRRCRRRLVLSQKVVEPQKTIEAKSSVETASSIASISDSSTSGARTPDDASVLTSTKKGKKVRSSSLASTSASSVSLAKDSGEDFEVSSNSASPRNGTDVARKANLEKDFENAAASIGIESDHGPTTSSSIGTTNADAATDCAKTATESSSNLTSADASSEKATESSLNLACSDSATVPDRVSDYEMRLTTGLLSDMGVKVDDHVAGDIPKAMLLILKSLRLLRVCGNEKEDVLLVAAHAALYFRQLIVSLHSEDVGSTQMQIKEMAHIVCVFLFLAHSHVLDNNCSLKLWHKHVFAKYCTLTVLNVAVMALLQHISFKLRVDTDELKEVCASLGFKCEGNEHEE
eukprot:gnl/TRDRNA2_/TRDRNA2_33190_c0_seq1.p1 gnl/TRDRNA2_/TRDRNA2_33190_c0~~gnl/TRDRNA2_/TRDRNA2_33190_c0_seq1.p1  ORF type:complete len:354 (+),score=60.46 gnl/TRDRNA2_/TRDRNA2_33190_c0_seq1:48-1109(+)